jgi:PKD repeat protein
MTLKNYGVYEGITVILLLALLVPSVSAADSTVEPGYITVGLAPVANFDALYAYNTVPAVVTFRDKSTGTTPLSYSWEFGDGATSTEQKDRKSVV